MKKNNPFKNIGYPPQEVPKDLKKNVMEDVNTAKLLMELTNLFSSNYIEALESLFKTKKIETDSNKKNLN